MLLASPSDFPSNQKRNGRIGKKIRGVFSFNSSTNGNKRDKKSDLETIEGCDPKKVVVDLQLLQQQDEQANNQYEHEDDAVDKYEYEDILSPLPSSTAKSKPPLSAVSQDSLAKEIEEMQDVMAQLQKAIRFNPMEITPTIPTKKNALSVSLPSTPSLDSFIGADAVSSRSAKHCRRSSWADYSVALDSAQSDQISCNIHEEEEEAHVDHGSDPTMSRNHSSWSNTSFSQENNQQQLRKLTPQQQQCHKMLMMKRQAKLALIQETKQIEERLAMLKAKKAERIARARRASFGSAASN